MDTLAENNGVLAMFASACTFFIIMGFWLGFRKEIMQKYEEYTDLYRRTFVLELQYPDNPPMVIGGYAAGALCLAALTIVMGLPLLAPMILIGAYILPGQVFGSTKDKRRKKINDVLPNVLQQMSANTKNIGSISLALQEVAETAPVPMDYELALISRQEQELKSFTKAMSTARTRIGSQWFDIVTAVLLTAEEKGGQISAALANLSRVFVQLKSMQNRIDTATSQGRMQMKIMLVMPFVVVAIVYMVDPGIVSMGISNMAGIVTLVLALVFYLLALGVAIWLSRVKI